MAIIMGAYCLKLFYSHQARNALCIFLVGCVGFLLLHEIDFLMPTFLTDWEHYQTAKIVVIKLCDNIQIHFSIRFFVEMYRTKKNRKCIADKWIFNYCGLKLE